MHQEPLAKHTACHAADSNLPSSHGSQASGCATTDPLLTVSFNLPTVLDVTTVDCRLPSHSHIQRSYYVGVLSPRLKDI